MKLIEYMRANRLRDEDFAALVGHGTTPRAVKKWKYRENRPKLEDILRIMEVTGGAVCPIDFVEANSNTAA
jgi:hypothetical protein